MSYTLDQRQQMAAAIDAILGTNVASSDGPTVDMLLDWMTAVANAVKASGANIGAVQPPAPPALQASVTANTAAIAALQTAVADIKSAISTAVTGG